MASERWYPLTFTCREVPVRNNPGISKRHVLDMQSGKWVDTNKYRATKRVRLNGRSSRVAAVFDNFDDAKAFRAGLLERTSTGNCWHRITSKEESAGLVFGQLVEDWREFAFLRIEKGTQQTYERSLRWLKPFWNVPVEKIDATTVDTLVKGWVNGLVSKRRQKFDRELAVLSTILHFYQRRKNQRYVVPVFSEHRKAADIARKAQAPVQALSREDLGRFFNDLRDGLSSRYHVLALAQFGLGLRIGEACGLRWEDLDLEHRIVRIRQVVVWDQFTWEASIKARPKNGHERVLVIPEFLATELGQICDSRDPSVSLVFHKCGRPLNRKTVAGAYNRALKRQGITNVSGTHMLRRTAATLANELTGDFYAVSKLLDHANPDETSRYVSHSTVQKRKVAEALNRIMSSMQSGDSMIGSYDDVS